MGIDLSRHDLKFEEEFGLKKGAKIRYLVEYAKEVILEHEFFPRIKRIILYSFFLLCASVL